MNRTSPLTVNTSYEKLVAKTVRKKRAQVKNGEMNWAKQIVRGDADCQ